jgi:hypothetical protein
MYRARAPTALRRHARATQSGRIPEDASPRGDAICHMADFAGRVRRGIPGLGKSLGESRASWSRQSGGRAGGILLSGDSAEPVLPAGPAHFGDFVSNLAMISPQTMRDLVHPDATNEHLAQRVHLRIRPLSAGIHRQRFVIRLDPPRIED